MADRRYPAFDYSTCMACRICVDVCPTGCIEETRTGVDRYGKVYPELASPGRCTSCGLCASSCPMSSISMLPPTTPPQGS